MQKRTSTSPKFQHVGSLHLFSRIVMLVFLTAHLLLPTESLAESGDEKPSSCVMKIGWSDKEEAVKQKHLTVEIGDSSRLIFDPVIRVSAFDGECWFKVQLSTLNYPLSGSMSTATGIDGTATVTITGDKVVHEIKARGEHSVEWDVVLYERPESNVFTYAIETSGINFFKQPPLTADEQSAGHERPDSVVNAYVMFHQTMRDNFVYRDQSGAEVSRHLYRNGGIGTIYRPKVWDAVGDTGWCDHFIDLDNGTYSKIVPSEFLKRAVYPVTIDPQFGNTTGNSNAGVGSNAWGLAHADYFLTTTDASTVDTMHIKMKSYSEGDFTIDGAVYTVDGSDRPNLKKGESVTVTGNGATAIVYAQPCSISLSGSTTYTLCLGDDTNTGRFYYDNLTDRCSRQTVSDDLGSVWTHGLMSDNVPHLYATYSVYSGGSSDSSPRRRIMDKGTL